MTWELRKIGGSGRLCLLLLLAVLCSGVLFALHATGDAGGYTVSALRQAMAQKDLPGYEERLWQELEQAAYTGTRSEYDALRRELSAADAALARVRQAEEYPSFRAGLAAESRLKLRMGLFEGFAARSLERGAAVYESLADVIPRAAFLGGPEVLLSFHLTDALALLFPLAAGLTLLTHERAAGLVNLTRPTRLGRSRVYGRKLAAAATLSTAGFVLLYGVNALIAGLLYGFAELDAPVQSLYGFAACPYRMTVGELLALAAGLKYLWLLCCAALSVQGLSVLMQVRTICPPEMTLRPLYRARLLHLPLSLLVFYLLLPQRAQETFSTLCGRVTMMRRLPPDCALMVFLGCCFVVCELSRVLAKEPNQTQRDKVANQS